MKIVGIALVSIILLTILGCGLMSFVSKNGWGNASISIGITFVLIGLLCFGIYLITEG